MVQVDPRRVLVRGVVIIAITLVLGLVSRFLLPFGTFAYHLLDMDGERSVPAVVSGGLLLAGGLVVFVVAPPALLYRLLGIGLVFSAFDEVLAIHEHLQRFTGVNWIKLYLPVFAACIVVGVLLLRRLRTEAPRAIPLFVAGSACWVLAQGFEWLEWRGTDDAQPGYLPMMFAEETLEDLGSLLILVVVLVVGRTVATPRVEGGAGR
ncbi:hypothetical protein [Amnibacterium endophyticum]|uniref:Uncharacterized protein n=1 Tax=Amnibacterium endophyticum TaxID=2109337 RepID=A0ABW4LA58_9MICO